MRYFWGGRGHSDVFNYPMLFILVLTGVYVFFPVKLSGVDAWYYGASIRYGKDLFLPHHLLYNAFYFVLLRFFSVLGFEPDVLAATKFFNGMVGGGCLWVMYSILRKMGLGTHRAFLGVCIMGFSFGFWRFTGENEAYIIPLFCSLLASLFYLRFLISGYKRFIFLCSLFAAIGALFHQIHIAWWLGLGLGLFFVDKSVRFWGVCIYFSVAILIPVSYVVVFILEGVEQLGVGSLMRFVLHDFGTGEARIVPGFLPFLLTAINFFRSFVQAHGDTLFLLGSSCVARGIGLGCVVSFLSGVFFYFIKRVKTEEGNFVSKGGYLSFFWGIHLVILGFHLLIVLLASGNAEFTAMIPALMVVVWVGRVGSGVPFLSWVCGLVSLGVWNFYFGVLGAGGKEELGVMEKKEDFIRRHSEALFVLNDKALIENRFYYQMGEEGRYNIENTPDVLGQKGRLTDSLREKIVIVFEKGGLVFTDVPASKDRLSRHTFSKREISIWNDYLLVPILLMETDSILWEVRKRAVIIR